MADLVPWGYGGVQLAQENQMNQQLMQMRDLSMQKDQTELDQTQADAAVQRDAAAYMKKIASGQSIQSSGSAPTDQDASSYSDGFRKTGQHLMQMGAPKQALEYLKAADTLDKSEIDNANSQLDGKKKKGEILLQQSDIMARDLGNATSQEEWNAGIKAMQDSGLFTSAQVSQFKNIPFHPAAAALIRQRAISVKDQATLDLQAQQNQRLQANSDRDASLRMQRLSFDKYVETQRQRERIQDKKTGKEATAPNTDELKSAETSVSNLIFNGKPPSQLEDGEDSPNYIAYKAGIQSIAANAKQMVRDNKGLSWDAAVSRATLLSKTQGDWDIQTDKSFFRSDTTTTTFNGQGKQPEDAIPMPVTQDNKPDPSQLKVGRWYISPTNGKTGKWNGRSFDIMQ